MNTHKITKDQLHNYEAFWYVRNFMVCNLKGDLTAFAGNYPYTPWSGGSYWVKVTTVQSKLIKTMLGEYNEL